MRERPFAASREERDGLPRVVARDGICAGLGGSEAHAAAGDARLAEQWKLLQAVLERARRSNTTNGLLIQLRMNYNQSALTILRGSTQKPATYGPDGRMSKV